MKFNFLVEALLHCFFEAALTSQGYHPGRLIIIGLMPVLAHSDMDMQTGELLSCQRWKHSIEVTPQQRNVARRFAVFDALLLFQVVEHRSASGHELDERLDD